MCDDNQDNSWSSTEKRFPDGSVKLQNPNIPESDFLYHLGIGAGTNDLPKEYGDIKFVCMGGTGGRMKAFAELVSSEIGQPLQDLTHKTSRFAVYKVGPVLSVSHGMGPASISILLHEMIKLMYHAKCKDPVFIRIGTSGGVGVQGGTVVISNGAVDGQFREVYEMSILGKPVFKPAVFNKQLAEDIKSVIRPDDTFTTITGKTMCANDFYEGQGRLDGAFCNYTEADKMAYLKHLHSIGVRNIEMESTTFAAMTYQAGIRAADVCVVFLNRLEGDQVTLTEENKKQWEESPLTLVSRYIKKCLNQPL